MLFAIINNKTVLIVYKPKLITQWHNKESTLTTHAKVKKNWQISYYYKIEITFNEYFNWGFEHLKMPSSHILKLRRVRATHAKSNINIVILIIEETTQDTDLMNHLESHIALILKEEDFISFVTFIIQR